MIEWLERDQYDDSRGWGYGVKRTHTDQEETRIVTLKQARIGRKAFFLGAPHVRMDYAKKYPADPLPSLWFVKNVVRQHHLQMREPKRRTRGKDIVARLLFPIQSIVKLGRIQQSADFIGKKFITGQSEPISIFAASYYQWLELYQIQRVLAETAENAVAGLCAMWQQYPIPHVVRIDNGMPFRGGGVAVGYLGRFVKFLLNLAVTPLFTAAYQSYTNPHVEGHNRTFTEKVWTQYRFTSVEEIDRQCARFNAESREFYEYTFKERLRRKGLRYLTAGDHGDTAILRSRKGKKICFIRFVERWREEDERSGVVVLNRFIPVPDAYCNQYVFAILNLETAMLHIVSEHHGISTEILRQPFPYTA